MLGQVVIPGAHTTITHLEQALVFSPDAYSGGYEDPNCQQPYVIVGISWESVVHKYTTITHFYYFMFIFCHTNISYQHHVPRPSSSFLPVS